MTHSKDDVIDDLLKLHPKRVYSDVELFCLEFFSKQEVESYLSKRFYDSFGKYALSPRHSAVVTRRANRIWERIRKAVAKIQKEAGWGIYRVHERWSWGSPEMGYIFAHSKEEAEQLVTTFFAFMVNDPAALEYTYMYISGPSRLDELIDGTRKRYRRMLTDATKDLETAEKRVDTASSRLAYLESFNSKMFSSSE